MEDSYYTTYKYSNTSNIFCVFFAIVVINTNLQKCHWTAEYVTNYCYFNIWTLTLLDLITVVAYHKTFIIIVRSDILLFVKGNGKKILWILWFIFSGLWIIGYECVCWYFPFKFSNKQVGSHLRQCESYRCSIVLYIALFVVNKIDTEIQDILRYV